MHLLTRRPEPLTLHLSGPALTSRLSEVRRRVAAWARGHGMGTESVDDVVLATHEALANVADHAYPEGAGDAWLDADCVPPGLLVVVVRDKGRWRPPPADNGRRGHGMTIIRGLAERVEIRRSEGGTTVRMWWTVPDGTAATRPGHISPG